MNSRATSQATPNLVACETVSAHCHTHGSAAGCSRAGVGWAGLGWVPWAQVHPLWPLPAHPGVWVQGISATWRKLFSKWWHECRRCIHFLGLYRKALHTGWLQITWIDSLTGLEASGLKPRGHILSGGPREESFLTSSSFWWLQVFLGSW